MIRLFESTDLKSLHHLLTSNRWEYFIDPLIDERGLKVRDELYFSSNTNKTLVYIDTDGALVGYIRFFDIENSDSDAPDFIVSVDEKVRGKGVGSKLVKEGVKYIFKTYDKIRRIEAATRVDNIPMQNVFESAGFVHEATYRKEWRVNENEYVDSLGYGILREEAEF